MSLCKCCEQAQLVVFWSTKNGVKNPGYVCRVCDALDHWPCLKESKT